jgi:hypothetical protein
MLPARCETPHPPGAGPVPGRGSGSDPHGPLWATSSGSHEELRDGGPALSNGGLRVASCPRDYEYPYTMVAFIFCLKTSIKQTKPSILQRSNFKPPWSIIFPRFMFLVSRYDLVSFLLTPAVTFQLPRHKYRTCTYHRSPDASRPHQSCMLLHAPSGCSSGFQLDLGIKHALPVNARQRHR